MQIAPLPPPVLCWAAPLHVGQLCSDTTTLTHPSDRRPAGVDSQQLCVCVRVFVCVCVCVCVCMVMGVCVVLCVVGVGVVGVVCVVGDVCYLIPGDLPAVPFTQVVGHLRAIDAWVGRLQGETWEC